MHMKLIVIDCFQIAYVGFVFCNLCVLGWNLLRVSSTGSFDDLMVQSGRYLQFALPSDLNQCIVQKKIPSPKRPP